MIKILRTDANNKDFHQLVQSLDQYLAITDGEDHAFYDQYNKLDDIKHIIIYYENNIALGCGAFKEHDQETVEIKRMFTTEKARGKGVASKILEHLESWSSELSYKRCILETGIRQYEAVRFYKKLGYQLIQNYGQYVGVKDSLCFEKWINLEFEISLK